MLSKEHNRLKMEWQPMKNKLFILFLPILGALSIAAGFLLFSGRAQAQVAEVAVPQVTGITVEQVTHTSLDDQYPVLAVDSSGYAHLAYEEDQNIYYATNASGAWVSTPIATNAVAEIRPSIAVDTAGHVHLMYFVGPAPDYDIYYATNMGGSWSSEHVGDANVPGWDRIEGGIAVDDLKRAYIVFATHDGADYDILLRYLEDAPTYRPSGGWVSQWVTDNALDERAPSIAVEGNGEVHIAYQGYDPVSISWEVRYATNNGGTWADSLVVNDAWDDEQPSIALDSAGNPKIAYRSFRFSDGNNKAHYAYFAAGTWFTETISNHPLDVTYSSLALDSNGYAHILYQYFPLSAYYLAYATNASGGWVTETLTTPSTDDNLALNDRSIAVDQQGYLHAVYYSDEGSDTEIYYLKSDQPVTEINQPPDVPSNPSPDNGAVGVNPQPTLTWSGGDPDGDTVLYSVKVEKQNPPTSLWCNDITTSCASPSYLEENTTYYWQVTANDQMGGITPGPVWSFTTSSGQENYTVYLPLVIRR
jgi:hypothetical protein